MLRTTKPPRCKVCRHRLDQLRPGQVVHESCIEEYVRRLRAEKAERLAKAERQIRRKRKEAIKTRREWLDECQAIANKIARIRDKDDGCISCDLGPNWQGQWHGSHFRSVGAASAVRLNLWNINKSCSPCNHHKSGNIAEYEPRLVAKIGQARVDWLKAQNQLVRYDIEYLKRYKAVMGKRLRRMEKMA